MSSAPHPRPRSTRSRRASLVALAAVVGLALAACGEDSKPSNKASDTTENSAQFPGKKASGTPVKVALITNEGGAAVNQPETREAADAARQYANDNLGGIAGHPIEFTLICKTKEEPATARDCANQAVEKKVDVVVVTSTGQGSSMAGIITKAGIPYVSASGASTEELTSPAAFMWTGGFPAALAGWAKYSATKGYKKFTAFVIDVPAATGGAAALGNPAFKAAGVDFKIVAIPPGTPDATPQVSAALKAKPDAVGVVGESTVCTSVLKALGTLGSKAEPLIIQPCVSKDVLDAVGSATDGAKVTTGFDVISDDPDTLLFHAIMKKYSPSTPTDGYAGVGYQGMLGLVRAAQGLTGDVSAANLIAAIKSASNVPLPLGHGITFTCSGTALPGLISVCSTSTISEEMAGGKPTNPQVITLG